jgi:hypothetical protein
VITATQVASEAALSLALPAAEDGTRLVAGEEVITATGETFHAKVFRELVGAVRTAANAFAELGGQKAWEATQESLNPHVDNRWRAVVAQLQEPAARMNADSEKLS